MSSICSRFSPKAFKQSTPLSVTSRVPLHCCESLLRVRAGGCGSMYEIYVVSDDFKGLSLVKQHKAVILPPSLRPAAERLTIGSGERSPCGRYRRHAWANRQNSNSGQARKGLHQKTRQLELAYRAPRVSAGCSSTIRRVQQQGLSEAKQAACKEPLSAHSTSVVSECTSGLGGLLTRI